MLLPAFTHRHHQWTSQYSITHAYGLFRRMTGVDGRDELVIEGAMQLDDWHAYQFVYKPGAVARAPTTARRWRRSRISASSTRRTARRSKRRLHCPI